MRGLPPVARVCHLLRKCMEMTSLGYGGLISKLSYFGTHRPKSFPCPILLPQLLTNCFLPLVTHNHEIHFYCPNMQSRLFTGCYQEISNLAKDFNIFPDFQRDFQISREISRFQERFPNFRRDIRSSMDILGIYFAISTPLLGFLTFQFRFNKHFLKASHKC